MRLVRAKVGSEVTWLRPDAVTALYAEERYEVDQNTWGVHAVIRDREPDLFLGAVESKEEAELRMDDIARELVA